MSENEQLKIEYVDIFELQKWPKNPKDHDLGKLHGSIGEFGFRKPIIVNHENNVIEAGHGRLDTLIQMFNAGEKTPKFIIKKDNTWLVPIISMNDDEMTQIKYSLADNRLQDVGGYNYPVLVEVADYIYNEGSLDNTGYDIDDIEAIRENYCLPDEQQYSDTAENDDIKDRFEVIITCHNVQEQKQLFEKMKSEGYDCRVTNSKK